MRRTGELVGAALVVAALMITAIIALIDVSSGPDDGGAAPAARSAAPQVTSPAAAPSAPAPSSSPVARTSPVADTPRGPITYTVKRGDNLTVIAAWFKLRGYGDLYERNRDVIGSDPDLIRPGQQITVSPAGVTMSR